MSLQTLVIDNYDSYTQLIAYYLEEVNQQLPIVIKNDDFSIDLIKKLSFDNIVISPGPGNPNQVKDTHVSLDILNDPQLEHVPILGICLGHQVIAHVFGGTTYKLKFGHRGANHPVKDLATGKVSITAQNHGYAVSAEKLPPGLEVSHINLNDQTVEGLRHKDMPLFTIQYHSEASPGPRDSEYLFDQFIEMVEDFHG